MGYRRKLDIIADVLHVASQGARKTQIMYQANLNHRLLKKYLAEVSRACLISFERRKRCYVLTSKGEQFLEVYKRYSQRSKRVEKHINEVDGEKKVLEGLCSRRISGALEG